ncbi:hypothetical protein VCRA217O315_260048 [Vibrio crassostreae]|nr:hypothetical protein VCRA217O315_260048 [Vibrio crassostreae]
MRKHARLELSHNEQWKGFRMINEKLELPTGKQVTPQEIVVGVALLEIQSELELSTTTKILRYVRVLASILSKS